MPNLAAKPSVKLNAAHLLPHVARIVAVALKHAPALTDNTLWITSANDGTHRNGSRHYTNEAFDMRSKNVTAATATARGTIINAWVTKMRQELGKDYDVILEHFGGTQEHLHIEFDPK